MKDFRGLKVYQRAKALTQQIYVLSKGFPPFENHELGSQLRRASSSIALNIAESKQFYTGNEIKRLNDSYGSASEVRAIIDLLILRQYIDKKQFDYYENELIEIQKMLYVMMERLRSQNQN